MAFAANAAQLVSAPVNRCFASGRLGLLLLPRRFKPFSFPNEKGPHWGTLYSFDNGGAFAKILHLYAEPFPLVA